METADIVWGGIILTGVAIEAYALLNKRDSDTLSEVTRRAFRVHSKPGAVVFGALWVSFAVWFGGHILWGWDFPGF